MLGCRDARMRRRAIADRQGRCRGAIVQSLADGFHNGALDRHVVAETDLALGRMDVDVDLVRRKLDEDDRSRSCVARAARIRFAKRIGDRGRGRGPSVDEDVLVAARRCREIRHFDEAGNVNVRMSECLIAAESERIGKELVAEEFADAVGEVVCGREAVEFAPVDGQREADGRMG